MKTHAAPYSLQGQILELFQQGRLRHPDIRRAIAAYRAEPTPAGEDYRAAAIEVLERCLQSEEPPPFIPSIARDQANLFLQLLGKDPATARLRAFPQKKNPRCAELGARKGPFDLDIADRWQQEGRGLYVVIGDGGDKADEIGSLPAVWVEWDDRPMDWQFAAWKELGLPEPSLQVPTGTGGSSVHTYWLLKDPLAPERWRGLQAALIDHCGSDRQCKDPSRVMRLPGAWYVATEGRATGMARLFVNVDEQGLVLRYSPEDLARCLHVPAGGSRTPQSRPHGGDGERTFPARDLDEIRMALMRIPEIHPDNDQRDAFLRLAWGLRRAVEEAGGTCEQALQLLRRHSPGVLDVDDYFRTEPHSITASTFWDIARRHGHDLRGRHAVSRRSSGGDTGAGPSPGHSGVAERSSDPLQSPLKDPSWRDAAVLTPQEVVERLSSALEAGTAGTTLELLQQELAEASGLHPLNVQRFAVQIERDAAAATEVAGAAQAIACDVDRQDIGQALTLQFLLPARVADAIEARTRYLAITGPSAAVPFLAGIAGVVKLGTMVVGSAASALVVPANLFACLVGRSGVMKSPAGRLLIRDPYRPLEAEMSCAYDRQLEAWRENCRQCKRGEAKPEPPIRPRILVNDYTGEALVTLLQDSETRGLGLLIFRDELAALFGSLNAYRSGRGGDEQQLLELFDGGGMTSLRIVSGGRHYSRSHVAIYGTIQPEVLHELVANGDASGLWARFLFVPVPERAVRLPVDDDDREALAAATALEGIARAVYTLPPRHYQLSPDAAARFRDYHYGSQQAALRATLQAQGALYGKSAAKVLRVAGLLHLLSIAAREAPQTEAITDTTVERAILLVDHLDAYALGIHADAAGQGPSGLMRSIHRIALASGDATTIGEIRRKLSSRQRKEGDATTIRLAMEALAKAGFGETTQGAKGGVAYRAIRELP
ncbi:DUF3987 domain-containing protein [Synechococcus sp. CBW1107]|uniref:DUF3987 domain-containing protein n=1 Tax=Synechococcus sp. CBW1107 TaxID=2789857 RepID=UPI002AD1D873|nr:DUF3987 domain-containing protein [Synechococcus sp. CBW1107]CAK6698824.1 hypothetical protein ICNINCKA_02517 [Synechococcus sp. CBW1107]